MEVRRKIMLTQKLLDLPRNTKRILMLAADLMILPVIYWLSLSFAKNEIVTSFTGPQFFSVVITTAVSVLVFVKLGLYRAVVRYMGPEVLMAVLKGVSASSFVLLLTVTLVAKRTPHSTVFFYWSLSFLAVLSIRFMVRQLIETHTRKNKQRVIIYGAGKTGYQLLSALNHGIDYEVVAMIDDDKRLQSSIFHGVPIYNPLELAALCKRHNVNQILLAVPSADRSRRREILEQLEHLQIKVRTVPNLRELITGTSSVNQLQDIDIEDLLGRESVPAQEKLLTACINEKIVMVTGAGGSIGSELCRQIIRLNANTLILFEVCEFMLYRVEQELQQIKPSSSNTKIIALLGDVKEAEKISATIRAFKVDTIYHAAAYKHVPLVEHNIIEGVKNNIFGTLTVAKAALDNAVETFVLISTDKAVRPTNIMGATKRVAELILQAYATKNSNTTFCMVRFGNVLGSSGSVVPLFCEQIKRGGPVTVTHEDIIRYFMTIPEAAQLVIQAGTLAKGGDVFLLDMGEPVKITELAKKMIRLSGLTPKEINSSTGDIEIQYTGLRPGEKLYEELLIDESCHATQHPRILRAEESYLTKEKLKLFLAEIDSACKEMDCEKLQQMLTANNLGYAPNCEMSDLLWHEERKNKHAERSSSVAAFPLNRVVKSV